MFRGQTQEHQLGNENFTYAQSCLPLGCLPRTGWSLCFETLTLQWAWSLLPNYHCSMPLSPWPSKPFSKNCENASNRKILFSKSFIIDSVFVSDRWNVSISKTVFLHVFVFTEASLLEKQRSSLFGNNITQKIILLSTVILEVYSYFITLAFIYHNIRYF